MRVQCCHQSVFFNSDGTSKGMKEPIRVHYIQKNVVVDYSLKNQNTGCFTTLGHNCRRWFPRPLWWKKFT